MKTRYLKVVFDKNLMSYEIPFFRAAVIEASDRRSNLFHNHKATAEFIYRYPLIQYKIINKKPAIICLGEATDDIHYLLQKRAFNFRIKSRSMSFEIDDIHMRYFQIQTWEKTFEYNILNYMPFNQEDYKYFKGIKSQVKRIQFVESKFNSHLVGLIKQLEVDEPVELRCEINDVLSTKYIEYKGQFHLTFNLNVSTNLYLPNFIGLGKGISVGFGILKQRMNEK